MPISFSLPRLNQRNSRRFTGWHPFFTSWLTSPTLLFSFKSDNKEKTLTSLEKVCAHSSCYVTIFYVRCSFLPFSTHRPILSPPFVQLLALSKRKDAKSDPLHHPFPLLNCDLTSSTLAHTHLLIYPPLCRILFGLFFTSMFHFPLSAAHIIVSGVVVKKNKKTGAAKFKIRCSRYLCVTFVAS
jgi:hypothetical protein